MFTLILEAHKHLFQVVHSIELQDIDEGEYEYETVYEVPVGATAFAAEGEMSGYFYTKSGHQSFGYILKCF